MASGVSFAHNAGVTGLWWEYCERVDLIGRFGRDAVRGVLRLLIAVNWTAAGVSSCSTVYAHRQIWGSVSYRMAFDDVNAQHPELESGTAPYRRLAEERAAEYRRRTEGIARSGDYGWGMMTVVGTVTALGLMAVFPKKSDSRPN